MIKFPGRVIFVICHLSFVISASYAQLKDLTITADRVSFEKEKNRVEAEGSVEVVYRDVRVNGSHLIYNASTEAVFADRGFNLFYEGISIEGQTLDYRLRKKEGKASSVKFLYQGLQLGGEKINVAVERFQLKDANFTTCSLTEPHYRVTAAEVNLYPRYGWLVAYWGLFWLGRFPLVPMPTYIYDFRAGERAGKNLPPFPEIGSNDDDGSYVNEKLAWYLRRELSGTYSLGYAANKGFNAGINANYMADDRNEGDIRLNWNPKNQTFGGITHRYSFGSEVAPEKAGPLSGFLNFPRYHRYELETTLSSHERINYQRVSFYPDLVLRSRRGEISEGIHYDFEIRAGRVEEEGNTVLLRAGGKAEFYRDFQEIGLWRDGRITPNLKIDFLAYSNGGRWSKPSVGVDLTKNFSRDLALEMNYFHFLFVDGGSPFNFENYRFRAANRLKSSLLFKMGETAVAAAASYFLDNWSPEDIDYSLFFKLHCYDLMVSYRSLRREFTLGFSLAGR
ncbi:LPS-assembly protein LptD [Candidatus Saganbacteria bacterium]|uniref:LPS-assembly protein LptD n=1 Tax=Candidatus Saganbacteria bacterium TaxID=2575572 RepID=A0A9D6UNK2_UNCSA|nr:LPS-assembly protein LptD [Candidatus Saganbacteria bacterium]